MRRLGAFAAAAALLAPLVSCRPLYLPPVPETAPRPEHTSLDGSSTISLVDGRPVLTLVLARLTGDGGSWLDVQWFGPRGAEVASGSVWVEPEDVGSVLEVPLPDDVPVTPGEWRAVVSHRGAYLRQFLVEVR